MTADFVPFMYYEISVVTNYYQIS